MGILDHFQEEINLTIDVFPKLQTFDTEGRISEGFEPVATVSGLPVCIWETSQGELLDSDRYKVSIDAIAISEVSNEIPSGAKIIVSDGRVFYSVRPYDIMSLGEVYEIGLQNGK